MAPPGATGSPPKGADSRTRAGAAAVVGGSPAAVTPGVLFVRGAEGASLLVGASTGDPVELGAPLAVSSEALAGAGSVGAGAAGVLVATVAVVPGALVADPLAVGPPVVCDPPVASGAVVSVAVVVLSFRSVGGGVVGTSDPDEAGS